jgi:FkbM family methyltransferase
LIHYFSQYGEDKWIAENLHPPARGVFVDVGAEDGVVGSNTFHFELAGWTGICIEPNPDLQDELKSRRTCPIVQCAIGPDPSRKFFVHPSKGWSGFDRGGREVQVMIRRLDDVLGAYLIGHIDLLSIDTEGAELDVLATLSLESLDPVSRPDIIVVEHDSPPPLPKIERSLTIFLGTRGYDMVQRTPGNLIFSRRERAV